MLTENQIQTLLQIITNTNFNGKDVEYVSELKATLVAMHNRITRPATAEPLENNVVPMTQEEFNKTISEALQDPDSFKPVA